MFSVQNQPGNIIDIIISTWIYAAPAFWRDWKGKISHNTTPSASGHSANTAVGAVPGPDYHILPVGCAAVYSVLRLGRYGGDRHLAGALLRLQRVLFGKRLLAVLAMTLLLFLLFVIPIALLVNSLVDNSVPLIKLISSGNVTLPDFVPAEQRAAGRR